MSLSDDSEKIVGAVPPGWYPDSEGQHRWWDGQAWGPVAPLMEPPKRKKTNYKAGLVALAVLLAPGMLISGVHSLQRAANDRAAEEQSPVVNAADGCQRIYNLMLGFIKQKPVPSDDEIAPNLRGLHNAAMPNDPLLASDLENMIAAKNATQVSDAMTVIMRRCVAGGHITEAQIATYNAAAREAIG